MIVYVLVDDADEVAVRVCEAVYEADDVPLALALGDEVGDRVAVPVEVPVAELVPELEADWVRVVVPEEELDEEELSVSVADTVMDAEPLLLPVLV